MFASLYHSLYNTGAGVRITYRTLRVEFLLRSFEVAVSDCLNIIPMAVICKRGTCVVPPKRMERIRRPFPQVADM